MTCSHDYRLFSWGCDAENVAHFFASAGWTVPSVGIFRVGPDSDTGFGTHGEGVNDKAVVTYGRYTASPIVDSTSQPLKAKVLRSLFVRAELN